MSTQASRKQRSSKGSSEYQKSIDTMNEIVSQAESIQTQATKLSRQVQDLSTNQVKKSAFNRLTRHSEQIDKILTEIQDTAQEEGERLQEEQEEQEQQEQQTNA